MGKGDFSKVHRETDKMAGMIDRNMAREKRMRADGSWKAPKGEETKDMTLFKNRWSSLGKWENAFGELSGNITSVLGELRDYHNMTKPQEAYKWIQSMYTDEIEPRVAWRKVKEKLGWRN